MFVTPVRLEQGLQEGCDSKIDMKLMGSFIKWVSKDVLKESTAELEASGLKWKQVAKPISYRAVRWYQEKVEEI